MSPPRMTRVAARVAPFALLVLFAACSGGLRADRGEPQAYTLRYVAQAAPAAAAAAPAATATPPVLQVRRPLAAPGLDSDAIAVLREGHRLDSYLGGRWSGALPDLVESVAIDALRARGHYRAVMGDAAPFASELVLQLEVARCEAEYSDNGPPVVRVRLVASFGRNDERALLATQVLEANVAAQANRLGGVAAAFEAALNQALAQLTLP